MNIKICLLVLISSNAFVGTLAQDDEFPSSFETTLYQNTIEGETGNVIISPISVKSALTLATFGANGMTKKEMLQGLKYNQKGDKSIAEEFENFNGQVKVTEGLNIASKIFVKKNYSVKKSFNDIAIKSFSSEAQSLDFDNSADAAKTINTWVEGQTNNKITDLIKASSITSDTRMILVNAIYFKGLWAHPFKRENTKKDKFFLNDNDSIQVDFMEQTRKFDFGFIEELNSLSIELPYNNSDASMVIFLPKKKTGLSELENRLQTFDFSKLSDHFYNSEVAVKIPKFKIEFDIQLNEVLKKMGMVKMFSDMAEFDDLLETKEDLKISKVVHKAFIEVNEEGAEAAAVTGVTWGARMGPASFVVNRPFMFMLRFNSQILFMGRVNNF